MHIEAVRGTVNVQLGTTFGSHDVRMLEEAVAAFGPFSHLDIDFAGVRQCDDAALARLASAMMEIEQGEVKFHGLTSHQWRLLTYMGVSPAH